MIATMTQQVGFGNYDKKTKKHDFIVHIRELSIVNGGIGCATWDAAIILSRCIFENGRFFSGKTVVELGAGVGLPGIVCSWFAKSVWLTDYLPQVTHTRRFHSV